jgi:hypothetical protein
MGGGYSRGGTEEVIALLVVLAVADRLVLLDPTTISAAPPSGWTIMVKREPVKLFLTREKDGTGVCLDTNIASFSINRAAKVDLRTYPVLTWTWRVDALPPRGNFHDRGTDDQAAQMFVLFERTGLSARRAINYIWDTNALVGDRGNDSVPLIVSIKTIVVKSGAAEARRWVAMRRNVADDYAALFGGRAPRVEAVRFQVNSQHTRSHATGCIREVTFTR